MKYNKQSVAYKKDISNSVTPQYNKLKMVRSSKHSVFGLEPLKGFFLLLVIAIMVSYLIYNKVLLDKIGCEITNYKQSYDNLVSEKVKLEVDMESKISLKNIEEKAKERGLHPIQDYQIEYVNFNETDKIKLISKEGGLLKNTKKFLINILSYIK